MHIPYTSQELDDLLIKVEDFLLDARKVKVSLDKINIIKDELLRAKFTPAMMSIAKLWIKRGKWAVNKTELEISDFFPDKNLLQQFEHDLMTKEVHQKILNSLKTEYEIKLSKLKFEMEEKKIDPEDKKAEFDCFREIIKLQDKILQLEAELKTYIRYSLQLERDNKRLKEKLEEKI